VLLNKEADRTLSHSPIENHILTRLYVTLVSRRQPKYIGIVFHLFMTISCKNSTRPYHQQCIRFVHDIFALL